MQSGCDTDQRKTNQNTHCVVWNQKRMISALSRTSNVYISDKVFKNEYYLKSTVENRQII